VNDAVSVDLSGGVSEDGERVEVDLEEEGVMDYLIL